MSRIVVIRTKDEETFLVGEKEVVLIELLENHPIDLVDTDNPTLKDVYRVTLESSVQKLIDKDDVVSLNTIED